MDAYWWERTYITLYLFIFKDRMDKKKEHRNIN